MFCNTYFTQYHAASQLGYRRKQSPRAADPQLLLAVTPRDTAAAVSCLEKADGAKEVWFEIVSRLRLVDRKPRFGDPQALIVIKTAIAMIISLDMDVISFTPAANDKFKIHNRENKISITIARKSYPQYERAKYILGFFHERQRTVTGKHPPWNSDNTFNGFICNDGLTRAIHSILFTKRLLLFKSVATVWLRKWSSACSYGIC